MTAYTRVIAYGPGCAVICRDCGLEEHYLRWQTARAEAHRHNRAAHTPAPQLDHDGTGHA